MNRTRLLELAGITEGIQHRTKQPFGARANTEIATLLHDLLGPAGIIDAYDELLDDVASHAGVEEMTSYHQRIMFAVEFINRHTSEKLNPQKFQQTHDMVLDDILANQ